MATDKTKSGATPSGSEGELASLTPGARDFDGTPQGTLSFQRLDASTVDKKQGQLWSAIRQHTQQIGFNDFADFVDAMLCTPNSAWPGVQDLVGKRRGIFKPDSRPCPGDYIPGVDLYGLLKLASEVFLLLRCGICPGDYDAPLADGRGRGSVPSDSSDPDDFHTGGGPQTPDEISAKLATFLGKDRGSYIKGIIDSVFRGSEFKASPFCPVYIGRGPCLMELIWSYWHEEGMLVQTTNAIALRFQNVARHGRDPLAEFALDSLRPLSGFIWGYLQDENTRLSVARRAYEYQHEYGIGLSGKHGSRVRPADSRSQFLQAFHDLLRLTDQFYREAADTMVTPDPFPLLIALRDLHMILAEGADNQFRDLPWTARSEMLVQQWLLARPETRDFLRGRLMVPYPEPWMGAVDAMKRLQGWTDTNVLHFHDLATFGEQLLLSVRHVRWDAITEPLAAQDWALSWRGEIQGYIHAYRMVTGVMLSDDVVEVSRPDGPRYLQPSVLLRARMLQQRKNAGLPAGNAPVRPAIAGRVRYLPKP